MIVKNLDLDIAVAEGVISKAQALQLQDLSRKTQTGDEAAVDFSQDPRDEPFRLLRGFRDIFIAIGVAIFASGLWFAASAQTLMFGWFDRHLFHSETGAAWSIPVAFGLCVVALILAEFVTRRQRLPLASLLISLIFAGWTAALFAAIASKLMDPSLFGEVQSLKAERSIMNFTAIAGAIAGSAFFYWRYRLPFALLPLAGSLVGLSLLLLFIAQGPERFPDSLRPFVGFWGVVIFLAAMWFDVKDRLRITRFSECAFWLHLVAAPLLVHTAVGPLSALALNAVAIIGIMALLSVIALLIDRRALLVSGLSYLAVAISQILSGSRLLGGESFAITALILGAIVLALGLGWTPIRRRTLALLPFEALKSRLPPTAA